ncbi:glycerophosphodiester phosphodiesterase [Lysinibacillus sphaericus]|uniref:Glycerophosphodiester phosphodiesterase-like protein n=1 Tax=Lysinibacillus sphaericus OT4b.31 TaxID=1285586 RepID=R7ZIG0_LYSSH|nr:glycerophosphodiester phosphodiesterase [Lysinibacillus sphaericus]EON73824.1 glycerophosphodiester phosphodiesterase-like protein [Lysinibacillus sphaericus OT4b.31]
MDIFAHRGVSSHYPENTSAAFYAASKLPIAGIELDVHLTADGEVVVIHDETIDRTSNGTGYVKDYTLQQLRAFDFGSWFSDECRGESILKLGEVLELFAGTHHRINIELKTDVFPYDGIEPLVIKEVASYQMTERVIISSFNHESIQIVSQIAPYIETAALFAEILIDFTTYTAQIPTNAIHVSLPTAFRKSVGLALEKGAIVRAYTVNDIDIALQLQQLGIDAIFTDDPEKMLDALREG